MPTKVKNYILRKISTGKIQKFKCSEFGYQPTRKLQPNLTFLNGVGDKIKRNVITQIYGNGGLRMIDTASSNKALKAVWIRSTWTKVTRGNGNFL